MTAVSKAHVPMLVVSLALLAAGCSSGNGRPVQEVKVVPDASGVQKVEVVAHSFWFEPNRIVVKANQPVELHVKNGGPFIPHNLTCEAPEAGIEVDEDLGLFWDGERETFWPVMKISAESIWADPLSGNLNEAFVTANSP